MNIKNIIFDLDGTLLDTLADLTNSVNYTLTQLNYPTRTMEEVRGFIGNGVKILLTRCLPKDTNADILEQALVLFKSHYAIHMYDHTRLYDGIEPMLNELISRGYQLAIVSNKLDSAVKELNERFFSNYITTAIGAPKDKKKPDPTSVLQVMEQLNATPINTIYIGDSDVDIDTANNASIPCVGVAWGFRGEQFLKEYGASYVIHTPMQLLSLLEENVI